eukprot:TRINITY_DN362_c0_g1_i2.p1 TRINITY_DN362_c0_g1~~TRINITY_DN362_c0_g1_i2.p1  ORF type:complete len:103 (+),score=18.97 TRINITY_DN362_c0_g1_i2:266-574(+)
MTLKGDELKSTLSTSPISLEEIKTRALQPKWILKGEAMIDEGLKYIYQFPFLISNTTALQGSMRHHFVLWFEAVIANKQKKTLPENIKKWFQKEELKKFDLE